MNKSIGEIIKGALMGLLIASFIIALSYGVNLLFRYPPSMHEDIVRTPHEALNASVIIRCADNGLGSGFHIGDGLIITNSHVVCREIISYDENGQVVRDLESQPIRVEGYSAEVIHFNGDYDLALIRCDQVRHLKRFKIAKSPVGLTYAVYSVGNHFGQSEVLSKGFVSAIRHDGSITTSPMNGGCSGGPLLNSNFQVIGVNQAILTAVGGWNGVSHHIGLVRLNDFLDSALQ